MKGRQETKGSPAGDISRHLAVGRGSLTCVSLWAGADGLVPCSLAVSIEAAGRSARVNIVSAGVHTPTGGPLALLVKVTVRQLVTLPLIEP